MVDKLLSIRSSYHSESPRVAIWDDKKVLFKLIDHSNFAVLTSDVDLLKLMIVNAKTGKIIFQSTQRDVDLE
jgi:ER membrane protein complex subunit 1